MDMIEKIALPVMNMSVSSNIPRRLSRWPAPWECGAACAATPAGPFGNAIRRPGTEIKRWIAA
jgi:hypothetical protein